LAWVLDSHLEQIKAIYPIFSNNSKNEKQPSQSKKAEITHQIPGYPIQADSGLSYGLAEIRDIGFRHNRIVKVI
jgi:hypothetical protein